MMQQILLAAQEKQGPGPNVGDRPAPLLKMKATDLLNRESLDTIVNSNHKHSSQLVEPGQRTASICQDTSYRRLTGITNAWLYIQSVCATSDGGALLPVYMFDSTYLPSPGSKIYGLLVKLNKYGTVLWIRQFEDLTPSSYNMFYCDRAVELPNRDIICSAHLGTNSSSDVYSTVIFRLDPSGGVIWKNHIRSNLSMINSPLGTFTFYLENAANGLNGDVLIAGTTNSNFSAGKAATMIRMNSTGQVIWDANYKNYGFDGSYRFGAEGIFSMMKNGNPVLVALSHGSNNPETPPAICFLTLDYATGNSLSKRFFHNNYSDPWTEFYKSFTYWYNKCELLTNGHMLFHGKVFSDYVNPGTPVIDHFGVVEFDTAFNLVNSYTIGSTKQTNYYYDVLEFDASGKGAVGLLKYIGNYEEELYLGFFKDQQFLNQRKVHFENVGFSGSNGFFLPGDNSINYVQSYFNHEPESKSYFEFRRMHSSDTSSPCLGIIQQTMSFGTLNMIETPTYFFLDDNEPNLFVTLAQNNTQNDTLSHHSINGCQQTNFCDTLKIHGEALICGAGSSIVFSSYKNPECGGNVQWNINPQVIDSLKVLSDSSAQLWFKNINWQGYLYAYLPTGSCYITALDSIPVTIVRSQVPVNLGPDTVICNQASLALHAGSTYNTYLWQDGSIDSTLVINTPGIYWVQVSDLCGNNYRDTINITAYNISVSIGPDRSKCDSDTILLSATGGFLNYNWSPNYYINSTSSQQVIVSPLTDTTYTVIAEKTPGCFAYDTVHVSVFTSPPIDLGNHPGLCFGDSILLDAGSGFNNYVWGNGNTSQQLLVYTNGTYSVIGTTAEGCKSVDTVVVSNVYSLPVVSLNQDSTICFGSQRILNAGNGFNNYLWNNGSASQTMIVNGIGLYGVIVTDDHGCKGGDTTIISKILATPSKFLGIDTAICGYGELQLKPLANFNEYSWSTGSNSSSIIIKQAGVYWLQVKDQQGCYGKDTIVVNPKDCLKGFYMPTGFTPNGDGKNDLIRPLLFGNVTQYQFMIYDRWGELVFKSTDKAKGWDGKYKGQPQNSGVFVWMCTYQFEGEEIKQESGTCVLIR